MTKISYAERAAGRRADYHVYYRYGGRLYFDAMWAPTEAKAIAKCKAFARELGKEIQVTRAVKVQPEGGTP